MNIRSSLPSLAAALAVTLAMPSGADARLAVRGPRPTPSPTPRVAATPTPDAPPIAPPSDGDPCQSGLRLAAAAFASKAHRALGSCLLPGIACLGDPAILDSCCATSASRCRRNLANVGDAGAEFEREITRRACDDLPLEVLLASDGLGFGSVTAACGRLEPAEDVVDVATFAKCLRRLLIEDVVHRMTTVEHPRALEAVLCMGIEDEVPGVLLDDPATCAGSTGTVAPPTPTPDPSATPDPGGSPGATPTPDPNATPTPITGPSSCTTVTVVASSGFDATNFPDVSGLTIETTYPPDRVVLPGFGGEASVQERVTNLSGVAGGLFNVADQDDPGQGPVAISVGLVAIPGPIPPGVFAAIRFDCVEGAAPPTANDFTCAIDASTLLGAAVDATCSLAVTVE